MFGDEAPVPAEAAAQAPTLNAGDTAWMLTATALVLFMTIPGLALFYSGMVRAKNVLSVMMQCFAITALVSVIWAVYGYSLAFSTGGMVKGSPTSTRSSATSTRRFSRASRSRA